MSAAVNISPPLACPEPWAHWCPLAPSAIASPEYRYLGPTPPPSPAPATPDAAPVSPPAVAASGTRPRPAGIKCSRCLCTSERGDQHTPACPIMREQGPSAVAAAPGRDTFADLVDEFDLLPDAGR